MRLHLLTLLSLFTFLHRFSAQEMSITGPDITQCGGFLVDNGLSAGSYTNNLNETIRICAAAPETIINLYWGVFSLGPGDVLEIYDGNSTAAPLIGSYTGTQLQSEDITSTNPGGCLTVRFVSDASGVGNFGAEISCGPPCVRPVAAITTGQEPIPVLICPGEAITFDASSSVFAPGTSLQSFVWNFDDGTTNTTSWPTVTHTFPGPGGYEVQLSLTDDNDCNSANLVDYIVLVSTYPDFSLLTPEFEMCAGGIDYIGVNFNIPDSIYGEDSLSTWLTEPWADLPDIDLGGALFVPDDQSQCFESEVTYSNFDPGQTITDAGQIDNFFINFEHSFMGDLTITFICPNGQSLNVHQQGGGGTFLGVPIDNDSDLTPGTGFDYSWSPDATNGTWAENSGGTLPSGNYESVQPFSNLVGCPLNGTWSIEVCDMWGSDNGYIFDWGISFDPVLFGDLLSFTPIYGQGCDSTWWEGPGIIAQDQGCDFVQIELLESGSYPFTYYATNHFGCTFDTTIIVDIFIAPQVDAGPDLFFECTPISMSGSIIGQDMPYVWQWSPAAGLSDPTIPNPVIESVNGDTQYTLTGYPVGYPGCWSSDQVFVDVDDNLPSAGEETDMLLCPTGSPVAFMDFMQGDPDPGGLWTDPNGNDAGTAFDPASDPPGTYLYTIQYQECFVSAPMNIALGYPQVVVSPDTTVCIGGTAQLAADSPTDYFGTYSYHWSNGTVGATTLVSPVAPEILSVHALDADGCSSDTVEVSIDLYDPLMAATFGDTLICEGEPIELHVTAADGGWGPYSAQWIFNDVPVGSGDPYTYTPSSEGTVCLRLTDGCETPYAEDCFELTFEEQMPFLLGDPPTGCVPLDAQFQLLTDPSLYTAMSWDFGNGNGSDDPSSSWLYTEPGSYDVGVYMLSPGGCLFYELFEDYVEANPEPVASWAANPQPTDIYDTEISFTNHSLGTGLTFQWQFGVNGALGTSTAEEPVVQFPSDGGGTYPVTLTVTDQNGCVDVTEGIVDINDVFALFAPNSFTPDNDGINDVFLVTGVDVRDTDYELIIFNRWGEVVFRSTTFGEAWTGNHQESEYYVPDGVYNYVLKAASASTTKEVELKGFVLLIR